MREPYPNELMHYGILGQKWGIRRYQNPDGTLTAAGRRRYGSVENLEQGITKKQGQKIEKVRKTAMKAAMSGDTKKVMKLQRKLSDSDVQTVINRLNLSKKLSDISEENNQTGMKKVAEYAQKIGTISDAINKTATLYDNAAKVANAFGAKLPRMDAKKMSVEDQTKLFNLEKNKEKDERNRELDSQLSKHINKDGSLNMDYFRKHTKDYSFDDMQYILQFNGKLKDFNNANKLKNDNSQNKSSEKQENDSTQETKQENSWAKDSRSQAERQEGSFTSKVNKNEANFQKDGNDNWFNDTTQKSAVSRRVRNKNSVDVSPTSTAKTEYASSGENFVKTNLFSSISDAFNKSMSDSEDWVRRTYGV